MNPLLSKIANLCPALSIPFFATSTREGLWDWEKAEKEMVTGVSDRVVCSIIQEPLRSQYLGQKRVPEVSVAWIMKDGLANAFVMARHFLPFFVFRQRGA